MSISNESHYKTRHAPFAPNPFDSISEEEVITIPSHEGVVTSVHQLVNLMSSVNLDSPEFELNVKSISDGSGGRILL